MHRLRVIFNHLYKRQLKAGVTFVEVLYAGVVQRLGDDLLQAVFAASAAGVHLHITEAQLLQDDTDAVNARLRLEWRAQYAHRLLTINLCVFSRWPRRPGQPWWSFPPLAGRRAERLWILSHRLSLQTYQTEPLHRRKQKRTHADFSTDRFKKLKSTKNKSRSVFCYLLVCRCRGFCTSSAASAAACLHSSGPPAGQSQPSESVDGTCPPTAGCHPLLWVMEMIVLGQKKKKR